MQSGRHLFLLLTRRILEVLRLSQRFGLSLTVIKVVVVGGGGGQRDLNVALAAADRFRRRLLLLVFCSSAQTVATPDDEDAQVGATSAAAQNQQNQQESEEESRNRRLGARCRVPDSRQNPLRLLLLLLGRFVGQLRGAELIASDGVERVRLLLLLPGCSRWVQKGASAGLLVVAVCACVVLFPLEVVCPKRAKVSLAKEKFRVVAVSVAVRGERKVGRLFGWQMNECKVSSDRNQLSFEGFVWRDLRTSKVTPFGHFLFLFLSLWSPCCWPFESC